MACTARQLTQQSCNLHLIRAVVLRQAGSCLLLTALLPPVRRSVLLPALALLAACRPDAPATEATPPATAPAVTRMATGPAALTASPTDTLHLSGNQVVRLQPSTAAAFNRLPADTVADAYVTAPERFDATELRVRRRGLDLRLQPTAGPLVKLSSVPDTQFTLQKDDAVRYQYLGTLPSVHQWVVRANYWESDATVLVDQRTGLRLQQPGRPFASPDGRHLLLCSPGLGGGDQVNMLSLVRVEASGPRLVWQREPTAWEAEEARWASPNRVLLRLRQEAGLQNDAPPVYAELTLPPTP
jgi:hypothetical protein